MVWLVRVISGVGLQMGWLERFWGKTVVWLGTIVLRWDCGLVGYDGTGVGLWTA